MGSPARAQAPGVSPGQRRSRPEIDPAIAAAVLIALLVGAAGFWTWLAFAVHTVPINGGETDLYVDRALDLLRGEPRRDALHPLGLPILMAALAGLGLDAFSAGRVIAIAGGLTLMVCTFALTRRFTGYWTAIVAAVAVGASRDVLLGSVQACTDVPAAALMAGAVLCWTRVAHRDAGAAAATLALGGLLLGLAASMRIASLAYAPACLPLLVLGGAIAGLRRAAWAGAGFGVGFAVHLVSAALIPAPATIGIGQIVWKYRYLHDEAGFAAYLADPDPVPLAEWLSWAVAGAGDLSTFLVHGIGAPWSGGSDVLATVVSLLVVLGMLSALLPRARSAAVLAWGAWSYTVALGLLGLPTLTRLTVPTAMPAVVLLLVGIGARTRAAAWPLGAAVAVALLALASAPSAIHEFVRSHPVADAAAIRQITATTAPWPTIVSPTRGLSSRFDVNFVHSPRLPSTPITAAEYWDRILADPRARAADFIVVGRAAFPRDHELLRGAPPPAEFRIVRDDDVLVLERAGDATWCASATATLSGSELHLAVELAASLDRQTVVSVGLLLADPGGTWHRLTLRPTAPRRFELTLPAGEATVAAGSALVPALLTQDGALRRGRAIRVR